VTGLSSVDETYRKYSVALSNNLKVSGGQRSRSQQADELAKVCTSSRGHQSPASRFD